MGVIIKYVVEFPDVSLKVSNDITAGDYVLDATISIVMKRGTEGCTFEISLFDLPPVKQISNSSVSAADPNKFPNKLGSKVIVSLGYFDGSFGKVMDGIIDNTTVNVKEDKLVTIVRGLETAIHALKETPFASTFKPGVTITDAIQQLLSEAKIKGGEVTLPVKFTLPAPPAGETQPVFLNKTAKGDHLTDGLENLVTRLKAEMLICDKTIRIGNPVTDSYMPDVFVPGINLGTYEPFQKAIPDQTSSTAEKPLPATTANGFSFAVIGDPKMRPAQKIRVKLDNFSSDGAYHIQEVTHKFSTSVGYTCEGQVMHAIADGNSKRREDKTKKPTADTIVDGLGQITSVHRKQNPSLEIGQIKTYTEGAASAQSDPNLPKPGDAHVFYGQVFDEKETQPSIHVPVQNDDKQIAMGKPIVSPFAWHKCGLVVPIYPGMKTVLSHNLALEDDSLITGFIWSEQPAFAPPPNKKGDWWLSLPVFTSDDDPPSPPPDSTPVANDLTARSGLRVIEVSGLRITVGKLQTLGTRPTEGSADEFLIEHKKASIHIAADGSIEILADSAGNKGRIAIASSGDITMSATGGVTLKVGASAVEIS